MLDLKIYWRFTNLIMKEIDRDGFMLCDMQGAVFALSLSYFSCGSGIFIRKFAYSSIAKIFDNASILDDSYTEIAVLEEIKEEYGELSYECKRYDKEVMYWMGYLYRYFCYTYEISMEQAYEIVPPTELAPLYLAYHILGCANAIEKILDGKDISFYTSSLERARTDI